MSNVRRLPGPIADLWDWQRLGACRGRDSAQFFHPDGERGSSRSAPRVRAPRRSAAPARSGPSAPRTRSRSASRTASGAASASPSGCGCSPSAGRTWPTAGRPGSTSPGWRPAWAARTSRPSRPSARSPDRPTTPRRGRAPNSGARPRGFPGPWSRRRAGRHARRAGRARHRRTRPSFHPIPLPSRPAAHPVRRTPPVAGVRNSGVPPASRRQRCRVSRPGRYGRRP